MVLLIVALTCLLTTGCRKDIPTKAKASETTTTLQQETIVAKPDVKDLNKIVLANGEWEPYFSEGLKYCGVVSRIVTDV